MNINNGRNHSSMTSHFHKVTDQLKLPLIQNVNSQRYPEINQSIQHINRQLHQFNDTIQAENNFNKQQTLECHKTRRSISNIIET